MRGAIKVALAMGINGDEPQPFIDLVRHLCFEDIVVNHWIHEKLELYRQWGRMFDNAGLRIASWAVPHFTSGMFTDPGECRRVLDVMAVALGNLELLGVHTAHTFTMIGAGRNQEDRDVRWERLIQIVRSMCRLAAERGVRICHHFGWTSDQLVWNVETVLRFLNEVDERNNGLLFCPGCFYSGGDDVAEAARRLGGRSFLVHARDARNVSPACENMHLGQGKIPYRRVLEALAQAGYEGVIVPEHLGPAAGQQREEISQAMAAGYLRALLESIGEPDDDARR